MVPVTVTEAEEHARDRAGMLEALAQELPAITYRGDADELLRVGRAIMDESTELISVVAHLAYSLGTTKKGVAAALDVPASTFRGMAKLDS